MKKDVLKNFDSIVGLKQKAETIKEFVESIDKKTENEDLMWLYTKLQMPLTCNQDTDEDYTVQTGSTAEEFLVSICIPPFTSSENTIPALKRFVKHLEKDYSEVNERALTPKSVTDIMNYLNEKFDFCNKVYKAYVPTFAILDYVNVNKSGIVIPGDYDGDPCYNYLLFKSNCPENTPLYQTPEERFCVLLGKTLFLQYEHKLKDQADARMTKMIRENYYPDVDSLEQRERMQLIYTVLAAGLMYGMKIPRSKFFKNTTNEQCQLFYQWARQLMFTM